MMHKSIAIVVLSCVFAVGCGEDATRKLHPKGQVVVHKLSGRRGQVIGYGVDDLIWVRFVSKSSTTVNGVVIAQESFEDMSMQEFEIEAADPFGSKNQNEPR